METCYALCHKANYPIRTNDGSRRMLRVFSTFDEAEEARQDLVRRNNSQTIFRVNYDDIIILKVSKQ